MFVVTMCNLAQKPLLGGADGLDNETVVMSEVEEATALSFSKLLQHRAAVDIGQSCFGKGLTVSAWGNAI